MAKRKPKPDTRGPLQRFMDRAKADTEQSKLSVITPEQRAKGTYQGERRIVNNHDPVQRWRAAGKLTESQDSAIALMERLWRLTGSMPRLAANYGVSTAGGCVELRALTEIEAREDLYRIRDYVPAAYFALFENVCRHGEAAEAAGARLNFGKRSAADRAHQVVCFVADLIAMKERL